MSHIVITNHMVNTAYKYIVSLAHERGFGFAMGMVQEGDAKGVIADVYRVMASAAPHTEPAPAPEPAPVANTP